MRLVTLAICATLSTSALAVDYTDTQAICNEIAASRSSSAVGFPETCSCHIGAYKEKLDQQTFVAAVDWMIDAQAFASKMEERLEPGDFMSKILMTQGVAFRRCGAM